MRNIVEGYSPKNNFWEYNPAFLSTDPFNRLYRSDKSEGKRASSSKMWAIALAYDPKSDMYNLPGKLEKISNVFRKNERLDIEWDELKPIIEDFMALSMSQADRSLLAWNERMKERDEFLKSQKYCLDYYNEDGRLMRGTADQLDKMAANTSKLYDEFFKIEKALLEEAIKDKNKTSTRVESLSDGGAI